MRPSNIGQFQNCVIFFRHDFSYEPFELGMMILNTMNNFAELFLTYCHGIVYTENPAKTY